MAMEAGVLFLSSQVSSVLSLFLSPFSSVNSYDTSVGLFISSGHDFWESLLDNYFVFGFKMYMFIFLHFK